MDLWDRVHALSVRVACIWYGEVGQGPGRPGVRGDGNRGVDVGPMGCVCKVKATLDLVLTSSCVIGVNEVRFETPLLLVSANSNARLYALISSPGLAKLLSP